MSASTLPQPDGLPTSENGTKNDSAPGKSDAPVREALLTTVAAAHLVAAALIALAVTFKLIFHVAWTAGPVGLFMVFAIHCARLLRGLWIDGGRGGRTIWYRWQTSEWIGYPAESGSAVYDALMTLQLFGVGFLLAMIGYGLWRRQHWSRLADLGILGICALFAVVHGVVLFAGIGALRDIHQFFFIVAIVTAVPMMMLLGLRKTAERFVRRGAMTEVVPSRVTPPRRRWWTLTAQWFQALLAFVLGGGLVLLLLAGPLVEAVWAAAWGVFLLHE